VNLLKDDTPTDLYLVRIWKSRPDDVITGLHGKLQHVVSGATCYFEGLASLPETLQRMMEEAEGSAKPQVSETPG
jgi:hypothetical protein